MVQVVPCFDPDEEMIVEFLHVVERGSSGQANKRINWKEKSFFLMRLNNENGQPGKQGQVEQPWWDVHRARSFGKIDDSVGEQRDWPHQEPSFINKICVSV